MRLVYLVLVAIIVLTGCHATVVKKNEINKIEIATGDGIRHPPIIGIIIDSTLSYKFYGGDNSELSGCYQGKITPAFWDTLNMKLKRINFKRLEDTVSFGGNNVEVIFYWGKKKRHSFEALDDNSGGMHSMFIWILNSYKSIQLSKLKDSIKFETNYQYEGLTYPPLPEYDKTGFPLPPKHQKK